MSKTPERDLSDSAEAASSGGEDLAEMAMNEAPDPWRDDSEGRGSVSRGGAFTLAAAALVIGLLAAQWLPSLGDLLAGSDEEIGHEPSSDETDLWTCPMHPHVLEHGAGECPVCGMDLVPVGDRKAAEASSEEPREVLFYRNPMDPGVTSPVPAKDSMGMDFVPIYADESRATDTEGAGVVTIDPAVVQQMNVRTEAVVRRDLNRQIRTVGYLDFDQERMVTVTTKTSGWIENVRVNYVGESVDRGQALFEIYSPELVQTQRELLSALEFSREMKMAPDDARRRAESLVDAARTRLGYWDLTAEQIDRLQQTGEVFRTLEVASPASGVVMKRMPGLEGMAVQPGMELFHLADLRSLWLSVEVFEDQVATVRPGTSAEISLAYFPGEVFRGRVRFLEPELSEQTRTVRARIEVPNPTGKLRKGMYATVVLEPLEARDVLAVPQQAVLRTGQRNVVVVSLGDGMFEPRDVVLGREAEGMVEVREGLGDGDTVVTSAQFLLDSESQLREAVQKMVAAGADVGFSPPAQGAQRIETAAELAAEDSAAHDHHHAHNH